MLRFVCPLIVVDDIARSRRFYEQLLGQRVKADHGENVTFEGGLAIHLRPHYQSLLGDASRYPIAMKTHNAELYFDADELEAVCESLEQAGVEFIHAIREEPWGQRVMRLYDPDGHIVEIGEPMEAVTRRRSIEERGLAGPEETLQAMGLELPEPLSPLGNYVGAVKTGNLLLLSGHGPRRGSAAIMSGKVGLDLTTEQGYAAARETMLNCLSTAKRELGSLDRVKRVVKVLGMVNCTTEFTEHPKVINGASDLLVEVFGEAGRHARSAVGVQSLPMGIPVEIEIVLEVDE
ncbi:MAG: VOC family protein [Thermoleophilia bacterium]|nr:VOC family protein [Thermoleophilia bacterium]